MKGRILVSLFALPFFSVGVWMLWSVSSTLNEAQQMRAWVPVDARILSAGYTTSSGDSDTYEVYAEYTYSYGGAYYTADRVTLSGGGDNIGDYQMDMGNRLSALMSRGETVAVYVDSEQPQMAIVDRSIRWGLIGFKSIFIFVFGGVGLFLLIAAWRAPREKDETLPEYQASPWLLNDNWQTPTIRSDSRMAMWGAWGFAAFWNLISAVTPFLAYREVVEKQNYIALVALLFPLVGIGLIVWAIRRTLEWRRFGAAPVTLDPFPGSIGGHVGGVIDLNLPFDSSHRFELTLTNVHHYVSGSGKNRSRKEKALWQDVQIAHAELGSKGTRLVFRFDVPEGQTETDAEASGDSYDAWRLNLKAELPGADLDRDYDIPVYATATRSRMLSDRAVQQSRRELGAVSEEKIRNAINVTHGATGKRMLYPMGRNLASSIGGFVIGSIFAAAGWYLVVEEGQRIFGGIFGGVGGLIAIATLYMMLNSLEVSQQGSGVRTVRRILGIPVGRKTMQHHEFDKFIKDSSFQTQSGGNHVMHYSIYALDRQGNKMVVGEGFKGESEANAAIRFIAGELGLQDPTESPL